MLRFITYKPQELGFIEFVVLPLYKTLASVCPTLRTCLDLIEENQDAWRAVLREAPQTPRV